MAKKIAHFVHPAAQGIFGAPIRLMTSGMSPFLSSVWLVVVRVIACGRSFKSRARLGDGRGGGAGCCESWWSAIAIVYGIFEGPTMTFCVTGRKSSNRFQFSSNIRRARNNERIIDQNEKCVLLQQHTHSEMRKCGNARFATAARTSMHPGNEARAPLWHTNKCISRQFDFLKITVCVEKVARRAHSFPILGDVDSSNSTFCNQGSAALAGIMLNFTMFFSV